MELVQKFLADGSRLQYLSERNWSSQALYLASNSTWTCTFDNFKQLNTDELNKDDYDKLPF